MSVKQPQECRATIVDSAIGNNSLCQSGGFRVLSAFRQLKLKTMKELIIVKVPVQVRWSKALNKQRVHQRKLVITYRVYHRDLILHTWFVPKVSVLIFLCTNCQRSTSMYIGKLVVNLAACPYLFQLDWLSQSCATAVCVWPCFLTSLHLRCRKISNNGTLSNFVWNSTNLP